MCIRDSVYPVQFLTESDAQGILDLSINSLNSPEQFLSVLGENFFSMLSISSGAQTFAKTFGFKKIKEVKNLMKKEPSLARLGVAGAAYRLNSGTKAGKLNLTLIKRGLETEKQMAYQRRLSNKIEKKRNELDILTMSGKAETVDAKILKNEINNLVAQRFVDKIKLSTLPILRSGIKESFPLSIGQYYFGEIYQAMFPEMDQFEGEMWGTLTYIAGGGFVMKAAAGKVGRGVTNVLYNPSGARSKLVTRMSNF